ncbi:transporter substrate-binding domain-containing protein [Undibacterium sp. CY18W]|uniref:Transporter substrate-binding domain-containing protein n=1 Tax=Undibacterium hunanense TaxID=2762292 RepID=A0ABR6ZYR0_9BURK|nr:transporter substrate-binding domain-containing protein [Undibacterium hunanense]MBC3921013.1 transporter substrate-binding domain-containing protein [Undibacterium hunanense]
MTDATTPTTLATITTLTPGKLTVCTYGGFAPVCYKDEHGKLTGLDVIFLEKFALSLGLDIVLIEHDFDGIWTMPDENRCDIAAAGVQQRDNRHVGPGGCWSDAYFQVQRSLLVRSIDKAAFDHPETLAGKTIIVTRGSTADIDAKARYYPRCTIQFVDEVAKDQADAQAYIVNTLIANHQADAFGEGDVSNQYLSDTYGKNIEGGLALADIHHIDGSNETFNFITRKASAGLLEQLNSFIADNKGSYAKA